VRAPLLLVALAACACARRPVQGQEWHRARTDRFTVALPAACETDLSAFPLADYALNHQIEWGLPVESPPRSGWTCDGVQVAYVFLRAGGRTEPLRLERKVGGRPATVFHSVRPDGEEVVSVFWPHWPGLTDDAVGLAVHCASQGSPETCRRILDSVRP
jgi:hypothetical protein